MRVNKQIYQPDMNLLIQWSLTDDSRNLMAVGRTSALYITSACRERLKSVCTVPALSVVLRQRNNSNCRSYALTVIGGVVCVCPVTLCAATVQRFHCFAPAFRR